VPIPGDTTGQLKSTLTVTNTSAGNIAYKIKTTAPRQYVVKPNQGIVDRAQKISVDITLIQSPVSHTRSPTFRTTKSKRTSSWSRSRPAA